MIRILADNQIGEIAQQIYNTAGDVSKYKVASNRMNIKCFRFR